MPLPFDATLKELLRYIDDWLTQLGVAVHGPVEEIEADLSTVTADADKVFRVNDKVPWLLHLEMQASRDESLPRRLLKYNGLLHDRHILPVHSVVVLLRPQADDSNLTGTLRYQEKPELGGMNFRYHVVRVWQWPVDEMLKGGLGTLPLAPLSAEVTQASLPDVIRRMGEKVRQEAKPNEAATLWTASYVLLGLRFSAQVIESIRAGAFAMKESVTYQAIVEEGRHEGQLQGIRKTLLLMGKVRFGQVAPSIEAKLQQIVDLERLERMSEKLLQVSTWDELLATV